MRRWWFPPRPEPRPPPLGEGKGFEPQVRLSPAGNVHWGAPAASTVTAPDPASSRDQGQGLVLVSWLWGWILLWSLQRVRGQERVQIGWQARFEPVIGDEEEWVSLCD